MTYPRLDPRSIARRLLAAGIICLPGILWSSPADAQMFGARQVGRPLSRGARPGSLEDVGVVRNQRFLRGSRSARNFVGVDRQDATEFVGMEQAGAAQAVRSAVAGLREAVDRSGSVNQPAATTARAGMYPPRMVVNFDHRQPAAATLQEALSRRLSATGSEVEVWVAGQTATLRGTVPSAAARDRAAILTSFEPGIWDVQNELQVAGDTAVSPLPPPPPVPADR